MADVGFFIMYIRNTTFKENMLYSYTGVIQYPHSALDRFRLMPNLFSTNRNRVKFNTSFESPDKMLLELGQKLGVASP